MGNYHSTSQDSSHSKWALGAHRKWITNLALSPCHYLAFKGQEPWPSGRKWFCFVLLSCFCSFLAEVLPRSRCKEHAAVLEAEQEQWGHGSQMQADDHKATNHSEHRWEGAVWVHKAAKVANVIHRDGNLDHSVQCWWMNTCLPLWEGWSDTSHLWGFWLWNWEGRVERGLLFLCSWELPLSYFCTFKMFRKFKKWKQESPQYKTPDSECMSCWGNQVIYWYLESQGVGAATMALMPINLTQLPNWCLNVSSFWANLYSCHVWKWKLNSTPVSVLILYSSRIVAYAQPHVCIAVC